MLAAFWLLLGLVARSYLGAHGPARGFVLAGCAALAVGTLQGPIQAFPAVHELLDRGGDAGAVIVNLHAQLNMLGGLLAMLVGLALALLARLGGQAVVRAERVALAGIAFGVATYYGGGNRVRRRRGSRRGARRDLPRRRGAGSSPGQRLSSSRPRSPCWQASRRTRSSAWRDDRTAAAGGREGDHRGAGGVHRADPAARASDAAPQRSQATSCRWRCSAFRASAGSSRASRSPPRCSSCGPCSHLGRDPDRLLPVRARPRSTRSAGRSSSCWIPLTALISTACSTAHSDAGAGCSKALLPDAVAAGARRGYRTRVSVAAGSIVLLLVSLPFVPAVAGVGGSSIRYAYETRLHA